MNRKLGIDLYGCWLLRSVAFQLPVRPDRFNSDFDLRKCGGEQAKLPDPDTSILHFRKIIRPSRPHQLHEFQRGYNQRYP
jgi:hypothetical protein